MNKILDALWAIPTWVLGKFLDAQNKRFERNNPHLVLPLVPSLGHPEPKMSQPTKVSAGS